MRFGIASRSEMYRMIENAAPIVRLAFHAKTSCKSDFHAAADPTDIVHDELNDIDGAATNILP
jgi:hypothetical protein